jgi:hypothetical protein
MISRNDSSTRQGNYTSRSSTGIITPPLIPVDDDGPSRARVAPNSASPTSLELLRRLEACVRELLEYGANDR